MPLDDLMTSSISRSPVRSITESISAKPIGSVQPASSPVVLPLDAVVNALQAFSFRLLRALFIGALLRLRRDSDNAESDFSADSNGDIDLAAIAAWLGGATGFGTTWYDQSGNSKDNIEVTAAQQPTFTLSVMNGLPNFVLDAAGTDNLARTDSVVSAFPFSVVAANRAMATGNDSYIWSVMVSSHSSKMYWLRRGSDDKYAMARRNQSNEQAVSANTYVSQSNFVAAIFKAATGEVRVDESDNVTNSNSETIATGMNRSAVGALLDSSPTWGDSNNAEVMVWGKELSSAELTTLHADLKAYWGTN